MGLLSPTTVAGCLCLVLLVSGCGGGAGEAARASMTGADETVTAGAAAGVVAKVPPGVLDDIARPPGRLPAPPRPWFPDEDWVPPHRFPPPRGPILPGSPRSVRTVAAETDAALARQTPIVDRNAAQIVADTGPPAEQVQQRFLQDVQEVTKDMVIASACSKILDTLAPEERPEEPGKGATWQHTAERAMSTAVTSLAHKWRPSTWTHLIQWHKYAESVEEDAEQLVQGIDGYSPELVAVAGSPDVRKALVVYLRTCYSPPRLVAAGR